MKKYICTVCGYIHETEGELPDDFKCPICGAGKDAFVLKVETAKAEEILEKPHTEKRIIPNGDEHHLLQSCKRVRKAVYARRIREL